MKIPDSIKPFVNEFSKLPGIGPRQAMRLAFYLSDKKKDVTDIIAALELIKKLKLCPSCFTTHSNEENVCEICNNSIRNKSQIAIIEKETDLISIESIHKYHGTYLCIGSMKKNGKLDEDQKIKLDSLKTRASMLPSQKLEEIIIAFSPTTSGDISAEIIIEYIRGIARKITKLGRGIPIGGEVEFSDAETLSEALDGRK